MLDRIFGKKPEPTPAPVLAVPDKYEAVKPCEAVDLDREELLIAFEIVREEYALAHPTHKRSMQNCNAVAKAWQTNTDEGIGLPF